MRPGLQIQLWMREAPRWQVLSAAVAMIAVTALLTASFVPTDDNGAAQVTSDGRTRLPRSALVSGEPGTGGTVPGAVVPGQTPGAAAADTGGPAGSSGGAGSTAASVPLTASDRGVTADTVKLGFVFLTLAGLENTPFYEGFRQDGDQFAAALANHQNQRGGILGRKVTVVTRETDPLTRDDQIQACTFMSRDQQVFAAIDPTAALLYADARRCFTHQNQTPLIHGYAESYAVQAQVPGYDIAMFPVYDRVAEDWVDAARVLGVLKPGMKVGVVGDRCEPSATTARQVLAPALKRAGASDVVFGEHDCTLDGLSQVPNIVTQFKLADIQLVFPTGNAGTQQVFQQAAKNQQYKPVYFESDWYNNACDCQTRTYDDDQFDGTKGVTVNYNSGGSDAPPLRQCSKIATDAGLPPLTRAAADSELVAACDAFFIFVRAAELVGPNLTRAAWARAIQGVGGRDAAVMLHQTFARGKFDGGDRVRYVEWRRSCRCYQPISDWMPSVTLR